MENKIIPIGAVQNVDNYERIVSVVAGGLLLYNGVCRKKNLSQIFAGSMLLYRGLSGHCHAYSLLNIDTNHPGKPLVIKTFLTINKPVEEVYRFWRKLDNLPLFMKHLKSVTMINDELSVWKANFPFNKLTTVEWESQITDEIENEKIEWRSLPGSEIDNYGKVYFSDGGKYGTGVQVEIAYQAPAGTVGNKVGKLLNPLLKKMIKEDIQSLRSYLEMGEVPPIKD